MRKFYIQGLDNRLQNQFILSEYLVLVIGVSTNPVVHNLLLLMRFSVYFEKYILLDGLIDNCVYVCSLRFIFVIVNAKYVLVKNNRPQTDGIT